MNYGPLLFLGILLTLASSWFGLVLMPNKQLGNLDVHTDTNTLAVYPQARNGEAQQGEEHYRSLGCIYCHSQQVRTEGYGSDIARGWGRRRSVSRDYIYNKTVMLGTMRTGPDLTNIGERQPDYGWQYKHLYNPQITSAGSVMPPYAFLFETVKIGAHGPNTNALVLPPEFSVEKGYEVVPSIKARQLVEYLRSLKSSVDVPEAEIKKEEAK
ncbi:MAG TPA: cbb3-type cytochrome c oxidase subunit II [Candidatus Limnocylindria bacterium]|jgi:cytochrome c oxidase cbb3-type subunit 2|nr:cbb3-type cytochrome c oxidase subunit II [Candidatus Limnocylindria bacterium]